MVARILQAFPGDPRLPRALALACRVHAREVRQHTGAPYLTHPVAVAERLLQLGASAAMVAAGLLHDVREHDPSLTHACLVDEVGEEAADYVADLTDRWPASTGLPRAERKHRYTLQLAGAAPAVHSIKLADIEHNTLDLVRDAPGFARVYVPEKLAQATLLTAGDARLRQAVLRQLWAAQVALLG